MRKKHKHKPPRYSWQTRSISGSFGHAFGDDVGHANTKKEIKNELWDWVESHQQVGADKRSASILVWKGYHADVTDVYPDLEVIVGPRGGYNWVNC